MRFVIRPVLGYCNTDDATTQKMEAFKAVEKEMKTKAFSKEGLSLAAKLDPKEQEKEEMATFLGDQIDKLSEQVEQHEAAVGDLKAKAKKGKKGGGNDSQSRIEALESTVEQHKWHQNKLELLLRGVENGNIEPTSIKGDVQDGIQEYVDQNQEADFDITQYEWMYEDFDLEQEERMYGIPLEPDKALSHEDHSSVGDPIEQTISNEETKEARKPKGKTGVDTAPIPHRRPSQHIKSPLPTLATLHTAPPPPLPSANKDIKPAPPLKSTGEPLRYASAAAAATATDKAGIGIAPLPSPNIGHAATQALHHTGLTPQHPETSTKSSATTSPAVTSAAPAEVKSSAAVAPGAGVVEKTAPPAKSPLTSHSSISGPSPAVVPARLASASSRDDAIPSHTQSTTPSRPPGLLAQDHDRDTQTDGVTANGVHDSAGAEEAGDEEEEEEEEEESIYHLPESLRDLVSAYETVRNQATNLSSTSPEHQRIVQQSYMSRPDANDAEPPQRYRPAQQAAYTPSHYPQEPSPIFNNPRLYDRIDTDSLFYSFYYRQGTYQQFLAAKALKANSWRFHKQYQTWFQRHEEPKNITEDYEQGTYRFFDYESTWLVSLVPFFEFALDDGGWDVEMMFGRRYSNWRRRLQGDAIWRGAGDGLASLEQSACSLAEPPTRWYRACDVDSSHVPRRRSSHERPPLHM